MVGPQENCSYRLINIVCSLFSSTVLVMYGGEKVSQGLYGIISDSINGGKLCRTSVLYTRQMQHNAPVVSGGPELVSLYLQGLDRAVDLHKNTRQTCKYVIEDKMLYFVVVFCIVL